MISVDDGRIVQDLLRTQKKKKLRKSFDVSVWNLKSSTPQVT